MVNFENLRSSRQIAEASKGAIGEATVRWWIFKAPTNGFDSCIVRIGRRVYINVAAFNTWLSRQREAA